MIAAVLITAVGAYLLGSIPSGYLLGLLQRVDVRETGSGNIGATNVARSAGPWLGIATLLIDGAKGFLPVLLAGTTTLWPAQPEGAFAADRLEVVAAVSATLGHIFSIFLRFRGGKGVATSLGALLALNPIAALAAIAVFAAVLALSRIVSLASIVGVLSAPIAAHFVQSPPLISATIAALALLVVACHRANMARLYAGTEPRIGE